MVLPQTCNVINVHPRSTYEIKNTTWSQTDIFYNFKPTKVQHVLPFSQLRVDIFNRLTFNSEPVKHSASITGNGVHASNTGLWQEALYPSSYKIH